MADVFKLTWHEFFPNMKDLVKELLQTETFSDVTLVSDDNFEFKVHRFILSACSSVFESLFDIEIQTNFIYLTGFHHKEVENLLNFIYCGEVWMNEEKVDDFLNAATYLKVKGITNQTLSMEKERVEVDEEEVSVNDEKKIDTSYKINDLDKNEKATSQKMTLINSEYTCNLCEKKLGSRVGMLLHFESRHSDVKHPCHQCSYEAPTKNSLRIHVMSVHNLVKYTCTECKYQFTTSRSLQIHKEAIHEGVRYPCKECDYKATKPGNLRRHRKLIHKL